MTRERNPQEPKPPADSAAGSHAAPPEQAAAPPGAPEPAGAEAPRKRKRRRKRRSGSQAQAGSPPPEDAPSAAAPAAAREVQPDAPAPEEDRGQRREADPADAEAHASGRRKKRRGGAKSRRGKRGAETAAEPGPEAGAEAGRHAGGEADNVGRAETVRSAGPAVDGAKPRKRRRKRRRSGAKKSAPPGAEGAESLSGGITPDEGLSGAARLPETAAPPAPDRPAEARTGAEEAADPREREDAAQADGVKACLYCGEPKPLGDFLRRTGKRSGSESRRGACRDCRKRRRSPNLEAPDAASDPMPPSAAARPHEPLPEEVEAVEAAPKRRVRRPPPEPPADALLEPTREAELRPTRQGTIRMRGRTDKGRRWQQETDLEMARCLVREHAAVLVNRFTIRRLYTNRTFRRYILERDRYTCHFCGEYGDTIDHLLPRAKGGHTTPLNCVCACMLCNQNKADRDLDEFMEDAEPFDAPAPDAAGSGSPSSP